MLQFLAGLLAFIGKVIAGYNQNRLIEVGKAEEKLKTIEAENEAIQAAKKIKADNAKLNVVSITDKLRKYQRD
jgi:hypothetical protein